MSPEQLQDSKRVGERTDIWSLGVVLYELLTGSRPFEGQNAAAVGARIATAPPPSLRTQRPDVPPGLEAVVMRCLEKEPDARYGDVAALSKALSEVLSDALHGRTAGVPRRSYVVIGVIAVLAVVVGVVLLRGAGEPSATEVPLLVVAVSADGLRMGEAGLEAGLEARLEAGLEAQAPVASSRPPSTKAMGRPKPSTTAEPAGSKGIDLMDPALRGR
jgi:serine/threonine-protein kinase